ncbi:hypothetical protein EOM09_02835 [bacterium]|nr:hypothetical protein [bacterium]
MKEKDFEEIFVGTIIIALFFLFILMVSISFVKNNPNEASNIWEAIAYYFRNLFAPISGK